MQPIIRKILSLVLTVTDAFTFKVTLIMTVLLAIIM